MPVIFPQDPERSAHLSEPTPPDPLTSVPPRSSLVGAGDHETPPLSRKIRLYLSALADVPFYRYGEIGNLCYTIGKNIMDGVILFTMFSMAQTELKVAAILGVMVKYAYPAITLVSSHLVSGFIDRLEALGERRAQITRLLRAQVGIGLGQALAGVFLLLCYPPIFKSLFGSMGFKPWIIVGLYLLHHVFDGSAQIVEGRTWFRIIEITIRYGDNGALPRHFWVIHALSQNFQLILGQIFLWGSLAVATAFSSRLEAAFPVFLVSFGCFCVSLSKFILPFAHRRGWCA